MKTRSKTVSACLKRRGQVVVALFVALLALLAMPASAYAATQVATVAYIGKNAAGATTVESGAELQNVIKARGGKGCEIDVTLHASIYNQGLEIPAGTKITINMDGWKIDRSLTKSYKRNGYVIKANTGVDLTINGGRQRYQSYMAWSKDRHWETSIDANGLLCGGYNSNGGGGIVAAAKSRITLNGVTIAGCRAEQNWGEDGYGGGIEVTGPDVTITMKNATIKHCYAYNNGGGLCVNHKLFNLYMTNSHIDSNYARLSGGGILLGCGFMVVSGDARSSVSGNVCGTSGGGIMLTGGGDGSGEYTIKGMSISNNEAKEYGGGMFVFGDKCAVGSVTMQSNKAVEGGGIYWAGTSGSISSCVITKNVATSAKYNGGAGVMLSRIMGTGDDAGNCELSLGGPTVIKGNGNGSDDMVIRTPNLGEMIVKCSLTRGADVNMSQWAGESFRERMLGDGSKGPNCTRYLTSGNLGTGFVYDDKKRVIMWKKGDPHKPPLNYTTVSASDAGTTDTGQTVNGSSGRHYKLVKGFVRFPSVEDGKQDSVSTFFYSDGFFDADPNAYNDHLATTSLSMAMSGFYLNAGGATDYTNKHASGRQFMADIGCDDQATYVNTFNVQKPGTGTIGVTISNKALTDKDGNQTGEILVPVAVRGAGYEAEWASNVTLGDGTNQATGTEAQGFGEAANQVAAEVEHYLWRAGLESKIDKVRFWVVGYSRAGATANLTSKRLVEKYGSRGAKVFGYTLEAPQGGSDAAQKLSADSYYCIHNVVNYADLVPLVGPTAMGFKRYGVDHYVPGYNKTAPQQQSTQVSRAGSHGSSTVTTYYDDQPLYTSDTNYLARRNLMLAQLRKIDPMIDFDDYFATMRLKFASWSLSRGFNVIDFYEYPTKNKMNGETFLRELMENLQTWGIRNRDDYAARLQPAFRETMATVFGMSEENAGSFVERAMGISGRMSKAFAGSGEYSFAGIWWNWLGKWNKKSEAEKRSLANFFVRKIEQSGALDYMSAKDREYFKKNSYTLVDFIFTLVDGDYNNKSFKTASMMTLPTMAGNVSRLMSNHYPEINLAWLRSYDSYFATEADTTYKIAAPDAVAAPSASTKATSERPAREFSADMTNTITSQATVLLDVKDIKGEAIYYKMVDGTGKQVSDNTCGNGYDIYRNGIGIQLPTDAKRVITTYAVSYGVKSPEVTYTIEQGDTTHKLTVYSGKGGENNGVFQNAVEEKDVLWDAVVPAGKHLKEWTVTCKGRDGKVRDVKAKLPNLREQTEKGRLSFRMPVSGTEDFPTNYALTVKAVFEENTVISAVKLENPAIGEASQGKGSLPYATKISWDGGNADGTFKWTMVDTAKTLEGGYGYEVRTHEGRLIVEPDRTSMFAEQVTATADGVDASNITTSRLADGRLEITVRAVTKTKLNLGNYHPVWVLGTDANGAHHMVNHKALVTRLVQSDENLVVRRADIDRTLPGSDSDLPNGYEFCGWDCDTNRMQQINAPNPNNQNEATFQVKSGSAVYYPDYNAVYARYKPVIQRIDVVVPVIKAGKVAPSVDDVKADPALDNNLSKPLTTVKSVTWTTGVEGGIALPFERLEADIELDYNQQQGGPEWLYAYAEDVNVDAQTADGKQLEATFNKDTNTIHVVYGEAAPAHKVSMMGDRGALVDSVSGDPNEAWFTVGDVASVTVDVRDEENFDGWQVVTNAGTDVTNIVLPGDKRTSPTASFGMPEVDNWYFSKDYELVFEPQIANKPVVESVTIGGLYAPGVPDASTADQTSDTASAFWDGGSAKDLTVTWRMEHHQTPTADNTIQMDWRHIATLVVPKPERQLFAGVVSAIAEGQEPESITTTTNADGSLTVTVVFASQAFVDQSAQRTATCLVQVEAMDANTGKSLRLYGSSRYKKAGDQYVEELPVGSLLSKESFDRWEVPANSGITLTPDSSVPTKATIQVDSTIADGTTVNVKAFFKPNVAKLVVDVPAPEAGKPLADASKVKVSTGLQRDRYANVTPTVSAIAWKEGEADVAPGTNATPNTTYTAQVTLDYGGKKYTYANDLNLQAGAATQKSLDQQTNVVTLGFPTTDALHEVTVRDGETTTPSSRLPGEKVQLASALGDKFRCWKAYTGASMEFDVTEELLGAQAANPNAEFTMPKAGQGAYDFAYAIELRSEEKPHVASLTVRDLPAPTADADLARRAVVAYACEEGQTGEGEYDVTWDYADTVEPGKLTYKATINVPLPAGTQWKMAGEQLAVTVANAGAETVAARLTPNGVTIESTYEYVVPEPVGKTAHLVLAQLLDANDSENAPFSSGEYTCKVNGEDLGGLVTEDDYGDYPFDVTRPKEIPGAAFVRWEKSSAIGFKEGQTDPGPIYDSSADAEWMKRSFKIADTAAADLSVGALYAPMVSGITLEMPAPITGQSLPGTNDVSVSLGMDHDFTEPYETEATVVWSADPAGGSVEGAASAGTTYTATITLNHYASEDKQTPWLCAYGETATVEAHTPAGDAIDATLTHGAQSQDITITLVFPATEAEHEQPAAELRSIQPIADAYDIENGTDLDDLLPQATQIVDSNGSILWADINWDGMNRVHDGGDDEDSVWTATGTVVLPDGVALPAGAGENALNVSMNLFVRPPVDDTVYAEAPYTTLEPNEYQTRQIITLDTTEADGTIYYKTSDAGEFQEYEGEEILLDRSLLDEDGLLVVQAYTAVEGKANSPVVGFIYSVSDLAEPPDAENHVYNGEEKVGVWGSEYYTLEPISPGVTIDEDGNAVATMPGTYQVRAKVSDGLVWRTGWNEEEQEAIVTSGDQTVEFVIQPASLENAEIAPIDAFEYTQGAITPTPIITFNDQQLEEGKDYELVYRDNVTPGTATIEITGKGGFEGSFTTTTFQIKPAPPLIVEKPANATYAGHPIAPKPRVTSGGKVLTEGVDYTLSYRDYGKAGTAYVTVVGKGLYEFCAPATTSFVISEPAAKVSYRTHVQTYGWQRYVTNGQMSGTSGKSKRLEGINIMLGSLPYSGGIQYRTHVQRIGWQSWRKDGKMAGTSGKSYRLEAIEIKLYGEAAKHYDVYYRVHCQKFGWMGWAKNGQRSGSAGYSRRLEGIQIVVVPKGSPAPGATYLGIKQNVTRAFAQKGK